MSTTLPPNPHCFAELHAAALFADAGWTIYFPYPDRGFDFIASRPGQAGTEIRAVQVKGCYPTSGKKPRQKTGYAGPLTAVHSQMVVVVMYFVSHTWGALPHQVAFMPLSSLGRAKDGDYICKPASFTGTEFKQRPTYTRFFGKDGIDAVASPTWS